jgi:hypothetical protein
MLMSDDDEKAKLTYTRKLSLRQILIFFLKRHHQERNIHAAVTLVDFNYKNCGVLVLLV